MTTYAQKIAEWAKREIAGVTVMTSNTPAYNHMVEAVERLKSEPWAALTVPDAMDPKRPEDIPANGLTNDGGEPLNK